MLYSTDQLIQQINQKIEEINFAQSPCELYEPIKYSLSLGGKRIRPLLSLMACNLFSDETEAAILPAIGLEIFHNFTLLHDDLMDKADVRRGHSTVHKKWSANTAILSGDAMQIMAYQFISQTPSNNLSEVLNLFSKTALEVCEGQQYDMDFEKRNDVNESEYIEMIRLKTAVLLACALKTGAIIGGAAERDAELLYTFGEKIGLAFQLKDDLLDTFGDELTFGKAIGGDIVCNKKTYLLINAIRLSTDEEKREINNWLHLEKFDKKKKIEAITSIYINKEIKKLCEDKINQFYQEAIDALYAIDVNVMQKSELITFSEKLMYRQS
ncbi:MAG: polyprenyl synthetase family protein [Bacteroidales bacterium]|nr:polyprenyl synthetase family protein [Bacteroidales bacterium]